MWLRRRHKIFRGSTIICRWHHGQKVCPKPKHRTRNGSLICHLIGNELQSLDLMTVNDTAPGEYNRYLAEYEERFLDTLLPIVYANSKSISYIPSSTINGYLELNVILPEPMSERYEHKHLALCMVIQVSSMERTKSFLWANVHADYYYDSLIALNYYSYRFAGESSYLSMPSFQAWQQALSPADPYSNSTTIELLNHHYPPEGLNISDFPNISRSLREMTIAAGGWYPVSANLAFSEKRFY